MVLKCRDRLDGTEKIVAYQSNEPDFTVTQEFRQVRINRQHFSDDRKHRGLLDNPDNRAGTYFYVYNYPADTDPYDYILTAKY